MKSILCRTIPKSTLVLFSKDNFQQKDSPEMEIFNNPASKENKDTVDKEKGSVKGLFENGEKVDEQEKHHFDKVEELGI